MKKTVLLTGTVTEGLFYMKRHEISQTQWADLCQGVAAALSVSRPGS